VNHYWLLTVYFPRSWPRWKCFQAWGDRCRLAIPGKRKPAAGWIGGFGFWTPDDSDRRQATTNHASCIHGAPQSGQPESSTEE